MRKRSLFTTVIVLSLMFLVAGISAAFDLTEFGFKPAGGYDLGGETVTIISWTSERMNKYFNDYLPVEGRLAEAEALFNCKIEWMQTSDIPSVNFNRLMAGESSNDLWHVQNKIGYWELVSQGAVHPMQDILDPVYYEMLPPSLIATEEALSYQGKYWGVGSVEWRPIYGYQNDMYFVAYNKTLFEREGLPDLYELYLAGEWDWDTATEIALQATQDFDGDGIIDQWGIIDARSTILAVANGASMTKEENGRVIFNADDPKYITALEQQFQWMSELSVQMYSYGTQDMRNTFIDGKGAMHFSTAAYNMPDILERMTDEWGIVPIPMGPDADQHYWCVQALNTTLIPLNAKDPEALAALRTFLWREEDITVSDFLASHVSSPESAQVLLTANAEWDGGANEMFQSFLGDFTTYARNINSGSMGAAAAMAEIKPIIQANLDDLFSQ